MTDLSGEELEQRFERASDEVTDLPEEPDNDTLLELYGLYKQATEGDVEGERPGMLSFTKRAKYDAWAELEGTDSEAAMRDYIELVEDLKQQHGVE
jgi:acyl-CoA-binding protein